MRSTGRRFSFLFYSRLFLLVRIWQCLFLVGGKHASSVQALEAVGTRVYEAEERSLFVQHAGTYIHTWEVEALVGFLRRSIFPGKRW